MTSWKPVYRMLFVSVKHRFTSHVFIKHLLYDATWVHTVSTTPLLSGCSLNNNDALRCSGSPKEGQQLRLGTGGLGKSHLSRINRKCQRTGLGGAGGEGG